MAKLLEILLPWGPVFFGVLLFAPMLAAVLDEMAFPAGVGVPSSLYLTLPAGLIWGYIAKVRGQWL